jgi:hypothetical protein
LPEIQIQNANIVLLADLNPAIFRPSWFAVHNLLRIEENEVATVNIVHPDVASFKTEWLEVNIVWDRFQIATVQESYYDALKGYRSRNTWASESYVMRVMEINRDFHFD